MITSKKTYFAALAASLLLTGCAMHRTIVTSSGLPPNKYLIGGGFKIEWTAPTDGTFIVADQTSGKILVTESATKNEEVAFNLGDDDDIATTEKLLGVPMKDVRIRAYWIPGSTKTNPDAE